MTTRFILQFNRTPSHALITCTPWTRWLTETESPSGKGHVIGDEIALRKTTNALNIITRIEVEQLKGDPTQAQRYLDASKWWLHRSPFGVERLPVQLIAQDCKGSLVSVDGSNVTSLVVNRNEESAPVALESFGSLPPNLKELRVRGINVSDFRPLRDLEILSVCDCPDVDDISLLEGCHHLMKVDLSGTNVKNLSALAGAPVLEEITAVGSGVTIMTGLSTCPNLKKVNVARCDFLRNLTSLSNMATLEEVDCSYTSVSTLAPLETCRNLRKVSFAQCHTIYDLTPLADMSLLEEIVCDRSGVATLVPLAACRKLRKVSFAHCRPISDLSPLAGMSLLEEINCDTTDVATLAPLTMCRNLRTLHLSKCRSISDLSPLSGLVSLTEIDCTETGVATLAPLAACHNLKHVSCCYCKSISDLTLLSGMLSLTDLNLTGAGAVTLAPLATCRNLKRVSFAHCFSISDLSALAGAPFLEELICDDTLISTLAPLATCRILKMLSICYTNFISDLTPLTGLGALEQIKACASCLTALTGLGACPNLRTVDFDRCASLEDLSGLASAPSLEEVSFRESGLTTIAGLGTCAKLKTVNFEKCASLRNLSPLAGAPSLGEIRASESGVTTIAGLSTCPNLKKVDFDRCASLRDLTPLAGAPALEEIQAESSGVTTITGLDMCPKLKKTNFRGCDSLQAADSLEEAPHPTEVESHENERTTPAAEHTCHVPAMDTLESSSKDNASFNSDYFDKSDSDTPEVGPLYTDPTALKFDIDKEGSIVALTPTVFRCNAPQDSTVYVPVPIGTTEVEPFSVSVRFTGISTGYVGCGFFKEAALDVGDVTDYLMGRTQHSIGCLLENGKASVFVDNKSVFSSDIPKSDELTMHVSFDRKKGMHVRIDDDIVNCDEFKDMSLFAGDLYFGISMSEAGQLAHMLPTAIDTPRFHYGMNSMDVDEDTQITCKHSVRASLSAHERWYGNADKCFVMRITNVCREPIGIGLVRAKLWERGEKNMVGGKAFGPHSIGLILRDRHVYVHFQDELIQWKPVGRMPLCPSTVDLVMRVRGGKVSFFYQGIPVIIPVIADLTLPADELFRAAYTMSDKGQTAVIPPNLPVGAPDNVKQRCSLLGDAAHVELAEDSRVAKALFAGALCFSSEAFAITPCAWDAYAQGCSGCKLTATSEAPLRGTLWLCSKCGSPDEFALCDACYWNEDASRHDHDRNTFIPLFGAGFNEMRLTVEDAKDSYLEVGVAPASYKDGLGAFGKHTTTTVLLGKVSDLVKAAVPAEKIIVDCPELYNGSEVSIRVLGTRMTILVDRRTVFNTTLSAEDDPFMKQPLRLGVRMGSADQCIRLLRTTLVPNRKDATVAVTSNGVRLQRECAAVKLPDDKRVTEGSTGTLVAVDAQTGVIDLNVSGRPALCPLACIEESHPSEEPGWPSAAQASAEQSSADQSSPFQPQTYPD